MRRLVVHFDKNKKQYLVTLALVSPSPNRQSRVQTPIFTIDHQHFLVQMAQARPGPNPARTRFWKSGNLEIQKFGIQTMKNMKILKIQIHVVQNVDKVWISRKKTFLAPLRAIPGIFP